MDISKYSHLNIQKKIEYRFPGEIPVQERLVLAGKLLSCCREASGAIGNLQPEDFQVAKGK